MSLLTISFCIPQLSFEFISLDKCIRLSLLHTQEPLLFPLNANIALIYPGSEEGGAEGRRLSTFSSPYYKS